jgi:hypothetical protein
MATNNSFFGLMNTLVNDATAAFVAHDTGKPVSIYNNTSTPNAPLLSTSGINTTNLTTMLIFIGICFGIVYIIKKRG